MSLRSRSHDNRNKGEKRQSDAAGGDAEPKSKRVALSDISNVTDYANDIVKYYQHRQIQFPIKDYLKNQRYINSDMRAALINWLVYAHEQFEMNHETLYLAVKLIDLFLSRTSDEVRRGDLKLLGGTALLLAAKFDVSFF
uniref:Cyclin N-terminal domain-containing protein n=1 Tax=Panagrolaimus davidi TaxID=227884 RepID=A0A914QWH6_9BILA